MQLPNDGGARAYDYVIADHDVVNYHCASTNEATLAYMTTTSDDSAYCYMGKSAYSTVVFHHGSSVDYYPILYLGKRPNVGVRSDKYAAP